MTHYEIVSPEIIIYGEDETNPPEHGCCVVSIEASSEDEAKQKALKTKEFQKWNDFAQGEQISLLDSLAVFSPVCEHGVCWCDICKQECEKCYEDGVW